MNKYLVEFLGTLFFLFVIIAIGHPLAIGAALTIAVILGGKSQVEILILLLVL